ncbi:hypothetical protein PBI_SCTP2_14 [Salicola phage SCTP-2]|nr:hypothetical protein PBI_SCTP2_14 [Salicola phage SCTP-2]
MAYPERRTEVFPQQMLTGALEYILIRTPQSLEITASEDTENFFKQNRVHEQIIEIIRMRANVVIVGEINAEDISMAVEAESAVDPTEIESKIQAMGSVDFGSGTVDLSGVTVSLVDFRLYDPSRSYA